MRAQRRICPPPSDKLCAWYLNSGVQVGLSLPPARFMERRTRARIDEQGTVIVKGKAVADVQTIE